MLWTEVRTWQSKDLLFCVIENTGLAKGLKGDLDQHKADFEKSPEEKDRNYYLEWVETIDLAKGFKGVGRNYLDDPAASLSL